jgi:DNA-binding HxlR family transcriptional regulator
VEKEKVRSSCPAALSLDILGDKWSLLIIRDLLMGKRRFADFESSPEGISTNILTDRLHRLEDSGITEKRLYQERPKRYEYVLTRRGADLIPVLQSVCHFGMTHFPQAWHPPSGFFDLTPEGWWVKNGLS